MVILNVQVQGHKSDIKSNFNIEHHVYNMPTTQYNIGYSVDYCRQILVGCSSHSAASLRSHLRISDKSSGWLSC